MRGDYAVIRLFPILPEENSKLVGEIVYILEKGDVKEWKRAGEWPLSFGADGLTPQPTDGNQEVMGLSEGEEANESDDRRQNE